MVQISHSKVILQSKGEAGKMCIRYVFIFLHMLLRRDLMWLTKNK